MIIAAAIPGLISDVLGVLNPDNRVGPAPG